MVFYLLTGTPGTGKTSIGRELSNKGYSIIYLNDCVGDDYLRLEEGCKVVDPLVLGEKIKNSLKPGCVVEGHLAHLLGIAGVVIVLRTAPDVLRFRLTEKGFSNPKSEENVEAEALDVVLIEALELHKQVFEIDTTEQSAAESASNVIKIMEGETTGFTPGTVSWLNDYFDEKLKRGL